MNDKEKIWKKLANKDLIMSPRVQKMLESETTLPMDEMIADLQEKLDDEYTVVSIHNVMDPSTFEPIAKVSLRRTKPYSEDKWAKRTEK